jgi:DNA-binding phage protein
MSGRGHNSYRRFLTDDKDDILFLIKTEAQRQGDPQLRHGYLEKLATDAGCSVSTLYSWFHGDTRRPQHLTVRMVLDALGCQMKVVRADGTEVRGKR